MSLKIQQYESPTHFLEVSQKNLFANEALYCLGIGIIRTLIEEPSRYPNFYL